MRLIIPPAAQRDQRPDGFHDSERPRALKKTVNRSKDAGYGEGEDEPAAARFERVGDHHGADGEESEGGKWGHALRLRETRAMLFQDAPVHDDLNPGFARFCGGLFMDHAFLKPDCRDLQANGFIDNFRDKF